MKQEDLVNEKGRNSVVVPFLMGGLIGAGIMLLLAPKAGKEVRKDIGELAGRAQKRVATTMDKGKLFFDQARAAVNDAIDAGKTAYIQEKEKHNQAA